MAWEQDKVLKVVQALEKMVELNNQQVTVQVGAKRFQQQPWSSLANSLHDLGFSRGFHFEQEEGCLNLIKICGQTGKYEADDQ